MNEFGNLFQDMQENTAKDIAGYLFNNNMGMGKAIWVLNKILGGSIAKEQDLANLLKLTKGYLNHKKQQELLNGIADCEVKFVPSGLDYIIKMKGQDIGTTNLYDGTLNLNLKSTKSAKTLNTILIKALLFFDKVDVDVIISYGCDKDAR